MEWLNPLGLGPQGFPLPCPPEPNAGWSSCLGPNPRCRSGQGPCRACVPHREVHTHTDRVLETRFIWQRIGIGFKKAAGQRAVIRHRARTGKGAAQLPAYMHTAPLPLFSPFSLPYSFRVHLDPSVSPPWSLCLFADKQPNYLITFSLWASVLLQPYPNVKPLLLPLRSSQPYMVLSTRWPW